MSTNTNPSNSDQDVQPPPSDYDGLWDLISASLTTPSRTINEILRCRTSIDNPLPNVIVLREELLGEANHIRKKIKLSENENSSEAIDTDSKTFCYTYVSQGFSIPNLFEESDDDEELEAKDSVSTGLGFELVLRCILKAKDNDRVPFWPADVLQFLGSYVAKSGNGFHYNQYIPLPLRRFPKQGLLIVQPHPDVIPNNLTYGQHTVKFVELIPVTSDELGFAKGWSPTKLATILSQNGLYPPNWSRNCIFTDPAYQQVKEECESQASGEGSSINCYCASSDINILDRSQLLDAEAERKDQVDVSVAVIRFSGGTGVVKTLLKRRLMFGLPAVLEGGFFDQLYRLFAIYFEILEDDEETDKHIFHLESNELVIRATATKMKEMATQFVKQLEEGDTTPVQYNNYQIKFFEVSKVNKNFMEDGAVVTGYEYNFTDSNNQ